MKFLFDLFPVLLFFVVYKLGEGSPELAHNLVDRYLSGMISGGAVSDDIAPILLSTAVAIVATITQVIYMLARRKRVDGMLWMSLAVIVVFGSATIYFHNDAFIKWKPTVLYWLFAAVLFFTQVVMKGNLIRTMMQAEIELPEAVWQKLGYAWAAFFAAMGAINLYVAFNLSRAAWVNFKAFGSVGLMLAFVVGQSLYLSRYLKDSA